MRWIVLLCAALQISSLSFARADEPKVDQKAKQIKIQGKFTEIIVDGDDKTEKTIRIPPLLTLEGKKASFRSGGAAGLVGNAITGTASPTPFGFSLHLSVTRLEGDDIILEMSVENSIASSDAQVVAASTVALSNTRKAKFAKPLRIVLEEDTRGTPRQWLDLTVTQADE